MMPEAQGPAAPFPIAALFEPFHVCPKGMIAKGMLYGTLLLNDGCYHSRPWHDAGSRFACRSLSLGATRSSGAARGGAKAGQRALEGAGPGAAGWERRGQAGEPDEVPARARGRADSGAGAARGQRFQRLAGAGGQRGAVGLKPLV